VLDCPKTFGFGADCVCTGIQARSHVRSGAIRGQGSRYPSGYVNDRYCGTRNDAAGLIEDRTLNRALASLGKGRERNQK